MRIECPKCAAAYEVPESRVGTVRTLRCGNCGTQWRIEQPRTVVAEPPSPPATAGTQPAPAGEPTASGAAPAASSASATGQRPPSARADAGGSSPLAAGEQRLPGHAASERLAPQAAPPIRNLPLTAAWIATVIVIAAAVTACFIWRDDVERIWPASARVLGQAVSAAGPASA